jgi:hypothetical protein
VIAERKHPMTKPRYLPPSDPRVTDAQTFSTYARVEIETLPGVTVTAGGRVLLGGPFIDRKSVV